METRLAAWLRVACEPPVVRTACGYAVIVGAILIAINHGPALLHGDLTRGRLLSMALTVCVPYCVSTLSSVSAILRLRADAAAPDTKP